MALRPSFPRRRESIRTAVRGLAPALEILMLIDSRLRGNDGLEADNGTL
jgi:hypothetical protein